MNSNKTAETGAQEGAVRPTYTSRVPRLRRIGAGRTAIIVAAIVVIVALLVAFYIII